MAEQALEQEEIIIIEESNANAAEAPENGEGAVKKKLDLKKILLILAAVAIVSLLALIAYLLLNQKNKSDAKSDNFDEISYKLDEESQKAIELSRLEQMIAKANTLYSSGDKENALILYEKIAHFSEALSQYNLGVAQLKEQNYIEALQNFNKAIQNGEKQCESAINAAVCSLYLKNQEAFDYYIELAFASLSKESNSPLYSYYYTLINYYKGNYQEALSALRHQTSSAYQYTQDKLHTKINTLLGDHYEALNTLENAPKEADYFTLALLYANIGDLTLSKSYLLDSIALSKDPLKEQIALSLIYLKSGLLEEGGTLLRDITDMYPEAVYQPYPITVFLKESLFDTTLAQEHYRNHILKTKSTLYEQIFYFSPYRVFNAAQTISYIRKGNANIYIDNISSAKEYLAQGEQLSRVNKGIAEAIQKSLSFHLRSANKQLNDLLNIEPKHSILNYNLALTYAQLGDQRSAYKYFLKSYHLDASNYLSGIYALMSAQLLDEESQKLFSILKENLANEDDSEEFELYRTLLNIAGDNYVGTLTWLENSYKQRPLYSMLNYIIASEFKKEEAMKKAAKELTNILPYDILPHLIYIDAHYKGENNKTYASKALNYLKEQKFLFDDLYYGPFITRHLYAQMALITGKLFPLQKQLQDVLAGTGENPQDIINALTMVSLYAQNFEESYALYNQLIDEYKQRDARTLFLGAVASIAAGHKENAIALLELAKMKDPNFMESRYALGLLYLEVKNNHGAAIQFRRIGNSGFTSEYFNFKITTDDLLFQRREKMKN
jgi:tetratricopeptide (TPR) repeat protein